MSTFGQAIPVSLFGESHGSMIGLTIHQIPGGIPIDLEHINHALWKRRPKSSLSTPRQEQDKFEIVTGLKDGSTTGAPITIVIRNEDTRSRDYEPNIMRPSHADFSAQMKYGGYQDFRGSGHFSGRLTAAVMILGSIAEQILFYKGIEIISHIKSVKTTKDISFLETELSTKLRTELRETDFPVIDEEQKKKMEAVIINAKELNDSVGGEIETAVIGVPAGYGEPFFDSVESLFAHLMFSIPAVKGISFGSGFDITRMFGSEANDPFVIVDDKIVTKTNHSGGIQGGITNGMPVIFQVAIKPTASIGKKQKTVDIQKMEEVEHSTHGRHDPAIVHRAVHVVNAMAAYGMLELIVRREGTKWMFFKR